MQDRHSAYVMATRGGPPLATKAEAHAILTGKEEWRIRRFARPFVASALTTELFPMIGTSEHKANSVDWRARNHLECAMYPDGSGVRRLPLGLSRAACVRARIRDYQHQLQVCARHYADSFAEHQTLVKRWEQRVELRDAARRDSDSGTRYGPKRSDLDFALKEAEKAEKQALGASRFREQLMDEEGDRLGALACEAAAYAFGLPAAEWADAALGRVAPGSMAEGGSADDGSEYVGAAEAEQLSGCTCFRHPGSPLRSCRCGQSASGWQLLLRDVDEQDVAVTLGSVLFHARGHRLDAVLALSRVNHALRAAARSYVDAELRALAFSAHAGRAEFPRAEDAHNNIQKALHYDDSLLSHCEPPAGYLARATAGLEAAVASAPDRGTIGWSKPGPEAGYPAGDVVYTAKERYGDVTPLGSGVGVGVGSGVGSGAAHWGRLFGCLAGDFRSREAALDALQAHAARRAEVVEALPLSMRALAACQPSVARALPLGWPVRLLAALAKAGKARSLTASGVAMDSMARAFVAELVPGSCNGATSCMTSGMRAGPASSAPLSPSHAHAYGELAKRAKDAAVHLSNVHRVAKLVFLFESGRWRLADADSWLVDCGAGANLAARVLSRLPAKRAARPDLRPADERAAHFNAPDHDLHDHIGPCVLVKPPSPPACPRTTLNASRKRRVPPNPREATRDSRQRPISDCFSAAALAGHASSSSAGGAGNVE
jgi:hypothetical protein